MSGNAPLNITGSLSDLQDIIIPDAVGFFPPAPAWYAAAGLIAFFMIRGGLRKYKAFQKNKYRRVAEKQLGLLEETFLNSNDPKKRTQAAMALPGLLKQTAISAYKRETVAPLSQDSWLAFLNAKGAMTVFSDETGRLLSTCAYGAPERISATPKESFIALTASIRKWIRQHA